MPRPTPLVVYLDANAVGHLVPRENDESARHRRVRLAADVREGRLEVVVSVILLQEVAAIGATNWPAHLRVLGYLRSISAARILRDTLDLVLPELRARHALKRSESRVSRGLSDRLWTAAMDPSFVEEATREAKQETEEWLADEKRLREQAARDLRAVTPASEAVEPNVWTWWQTDPAEHIRIFAAETARARGADLAPSEYARLPAFWRFHAYKVARIALMHSRRPGSGLKPTDGVDAHHYAVAGYADVLVSDDGPLRLTAEVIPRLPQPITLDEFARTYLGERRGDEGS